MTKVVSILLTLVGLILVLKGQTTNGLIFMAIARTYDIEDALVSKEKK